MEVVVVRHGHRLNWVQEDWGVEWQKNRPNDSPLSDVGLQQARELAQHLTQRPVSMIYASPYFRTLQTANEIALLAGVPIHVENGISEWTNSEKYQKEETITPKELAESFPLAKAEGQSLYATEPEPESLDEIQERVKRFVALFEEKEKFEEGKRIILVSHAATSILLIRELLHRPDFNDPISTCSKTVLTKASPTDDWHLASEPGCAAHLSGGVASPWHFPSPSPEVDQ